MAASTTETVSASDPSVGLATEPRAPVDAAPHCDGRSDYRSDPGIDREAQSLVQMLGAAFDASAVDHRPRAAERPLDWQRMIKLAERHRVMPQLHRQLASARTDIVPREIEATLRQFLLVNGARNLELGVELQALVRTFEERGIRTLAIKGPSISIAAYGDEAARQSGDLDLLVDRSDYDDARHVLSERGLALDADWGWECSYTDAKRALSVDLHCALTAPAFRLNLPFRALYARRAEIPFRGGVLPSLSLEDMLLVQCIQVVKDGWGRVSVLTKLCDIAALVRNRPELDWERAIALARGLGCRRILGVGLGLAQDLLQANVPAAVRSRLFEPEVEHVAARIANDLVPGIRSDAAPMDNHRYYHAARERWRDRRLPAIERWLKLALEPNDRDRAYVALPPSFHFAYYLVRPLRLGHEWGRRVMDHRGHDQ